MRENWKRVLLKRCVNGTLEVSCSERPLYWLDDKETVEEFVSLLTAVGGGGGGIVLWLVGKFVLEWTICEPSIDPDDETTIGPECIWLPIKIDDVELVEGLVSCKCICNVCGPTEAALWWTGGGATDEDEGIWAEINHFVDA